MKFIQIGKILNSHGVKGELKVIPLTSHTDRFDDLAGAYIGLKKEYYEIESVKKSKGNVILKFENINNVNDAKKMINLFISVDENEAVKGKDSFYIFELMGMEVYDLSNNYIGKIEEIIQTKANDVYMVKNDDKEYFIPAVKEFIKEIDVNNKKMVISPIEGMVE